MTYRLTYDARADSSRQLELEVEPSRFEEEEEARRTYLAALAAVLEAERATAADVAEIRLREARAAEEHYAAIDAKVRAAGDVAVAEPAHRPPPSRRPPPGRRQGPAAPHPGPVG